MKKIFIIIILSLSIVIFKAYYDFNAISSSVIRLHVVANSNQDIDQNIKLKVRDYVLSKYSLAFENIAGADSYINNNLTNITNDVTEFLKNNGYKYSGKAEYSNFNFPTKNYTKFKFPKGKYKALKITLGSGAGENWWCVMFPPLCVSNNCYSDSKNDNQLLKNSLSSNQYEIVTNINYEFKIIELINTLKEKF